MDGSTAQCCAPQVEGDTEPINSGDTQLVGAGVASRELPGQAELQRRRRESLGSSEWRGSLPCYSQHSLGREPRSGAELLHRAALLGSGSSSGSESKKVVVTVESDSRQSGLPQ